MEQQSRLKQRLVGAIVLVALGVIFIPMILDGKREPGFIVNGSSIPVKPTEIKNIRQIEFASNDSAATDRHDAEQDKIRIPIDKRSAPLSTVTKVPVAASHASSSKLKTGKPETTASPVVRQKRKVSTVSATQAWAIQVGSFKQRSNAFKLRDKLRKHKYKAFVEGIRSRNAKLIYRVRLGPYISRAGAEQVRDSLLAQQKMKGLLVRHP
ncbi:MAG: hypothetical protein GXP11_02750 [Gammaproteobacteria bacterium]|nr:hypothetical protein [Gammaproteobacteria bacterium]